MVKSAVHPAMISYPVAAGERAEVRPRSTPRQTSPETLGEASERGGVILGVYLNRPSTGGNQWVIEGDRSRW